MPRIPVLQPQQSPSGFLQPGRVESSAPDLSGLVRGINQRTVNLQRDEAQFEHELQVQERQREVADTAAAREQYLSIKDLLADGYEEHQAGVLDGSIDKTSALTKWSERTKALIDLGIEKVPPSQRAKVQSMLSTDASRFERLVGRVVRKKDQTDTAAAIDKTLEFAARQSETDYEGARIMAMQTLQELGPWAGLNSAQIQAKANAWREEAAYTRGLGALSRAKDDNAALSKVEAAIGEMSDLDPRKKVELLDRAANYKARNDQRAEIDANRRERNVERVLRVAEHEFNAFQALADKGGALSPEYIDRVVKATAGTPYQAAVRGVADTVRANGGLALRPIRDQEATLAEIDAQIAQSGRTPELDKRRERVAKLAAASRSDAERDPLAAYAERGGGVAPGVDVSSLDTLAQTLQARAEHAVTVGRWAGRTVSPLSPVEADRVADQLAALPVEQRSARVAQLASAMTPQQAQALARQMDGKNRALALEFAAGSSKTASGKYVAEWIARGNQALKDKTVKEDTTTTTGLRKSIAEHIGDSLRGPIREDVIDAARLVYIGQQSAGLSPSPQGAVALALGGPLTEHAGKRIPVPQGINLADKLQRYPVQDIAAQAPDGFVYLPGGRPMGVPEFLGALPSAQLEPAGYGRYVVRSGGSLVLNQRREPVVIDVIK